MLVPFFVFSIWGFFLLEGGGGLGGWGGVVCVWVGEEELPPSPGVFYMQILKLLFDSFIYAFPKKYTYMMLTFKLIYSSFHSLPMKFNFQIYANAGVLDNQEKLEEV